MQNWGILILVIAVFVANLPGVMEQWRSDRPGFIKTLWFMAAYAPCVEWFRECLLHPKADVRRARSKSPLSANSGRQLPLQFG